MPNNGFKDVTQLGGPFDPGGQPDLENGQKLQLGFFGWNVRAGMTMSTAILEDEERLADYWKWPTASKLLTLADEIGFDYQVPFGRWIGAGGKTDFNGAGLDFLATAAASAPITKQIDLVSTAHINFGFHPLHIAKFGATIDHISNGRWGLNIVTGSHATERAAFGLGEFDRDEAYSLAEEFVTLMKHLWHETERFNFEGKYFQSYGTTVNPRATRNPRPVLMNAGGSPRGIDFAVRNVDVLFTIAPSIEEYPAKVREIHDGANKYGRKIKVATMVWGNIEATDEIAQEKQDHYLANPDTEAVTNYFRALSSSGATFGIDGAEDKPSDEFVQSFILGFSAPRLSGSPQTVAEQMAALYETGVETIFICFADPLRGLHLMQEEVLPILKKMGLRK